MELFGFDNNFDKVIIVEGTSDKKKIAPLIQEPIEIICTNGTISAQKLEELVDNHSLDNKEVYILADADDAGDKLRRQFLRELPNASHIYIDKMYREVATAPEYHLATVLISKNIDVDPKYLTK
ncbi:toprim domain-containing protein [Bacillus sp. Marseille-P3661]|uniref:toprim domain-containing protein n=1 Tax=Bacillus sp. Marseille-P3661 TaxID=1936234 RepID=UPI000C818B5B|nr:toprim domain-containing protein [Bacillus sp. Marseille-P3661]